MAKESKRGFKKFYYGATMNGTYRMVMIMLTIILMATNIPSTALAANDTANGTTTENEAAITAKVDLTAGLVAGTNYGDANVGIYTLGDTKYKAGSVDVLNESPVAGHTEGGDNPSPKNGEIPTSGVAIKFVPAISTTVGVVVKGNTEKALHYVTEKDGVKTASEVIAEADSVNGQYYRLTFNMEAGSIYYLYRSGSKIAIGEITYTTTESGAQKENTSTNKILAFEGAEGGGMYATGGRGGDVYVVTSLADYGRNDAKMEGTLRYGIETAPDAGRIIVFHVGGTIHLKQTLSFSGKKNITLAGQTAPGEGITCAGYDTNISNSENLIIRFIHFRPGTENLLNGGDSMDALWGRDNSTFIIDHCSFSWNTDECLSTYRGKDGTVQWCIVSESLTVSGHSKGRHGYGGIFGGDNTVFQYNLITNHTSRNPRIGGGSMTDPTSTESYATLQVSNNVLYNHGYYACYGGGYAYTNYINNYNITGPGTRDSILNRLIDYGESGKIGGVYVDGNVVISEGIDISDKVTINIDPVNTTTLADKAYESAAFNTVSLVTANEAKDLVLNRAGVTYPKRDAIDARVVAQVETGTGFYVNTPDEVGGYCAPEVTREAGFDTDMDGIPDAWETANGLNPADASDSAKLNDTGYAWVEVYAMDLVKDVIAADYQALNPAVTIDLENNTQIEEGTGITVTATAVANNGGSIDKVLFMNGGEIIATIENAPYTYTYTGLSDGTYDISVRAYDDAGNGTQSDTKKLHVNSTAGTGEWSSADVGNPGIAGSASYVDGILTVKGAGKLGSHEGNSSTVDSQNGTNYSDAKVDEFHYVYREMTGDAELVAKLDSFTVVDAHTFNGLMFRESLDTNAAAVGLGLSMVKVENSTVWSAFMANRSKTDTGMTAINGSIDSADSAASKNIPMVQDLNFKSGDTFNGTWLKLMRKGDTFTGYVSEDNLNWTEVGSITVDLPDTVYVGFAVDANKVANDIENLATAKFSGIELNTEWCNLTFETENVFISGTEQIAIGKDIALQLSKADGYLLPETVSVVNEKGMEIPFAYDSESGVLSITNITENLIIKATGAERTVGAVGYEIVDEGNFLTITESDGTIVLAQSATEGKVAGNSTTASVNMSYLLFPETTESQKMTMTIKITEMKTIGDGKKNGLFIGAFATESHAFNSVCFRAYNSEDNFSGFWVKDSDKAGNGSPKLQHTLNTEYDIEFGMDSSKQFYVNATNKSDGTVMSKIFKTHENFLQSGDAVRYGIGILGATVEVTNLTLTDYENNVIFPGTGISESEGAVDSTLEEKPNDAKTEDAKQEDVSKPVSNLEDEDSVADNTDSDNANHSMAWLWVLAVVILLGVLGFVAFTKYKTKTNK